MTIDDKTYKDIIKEDTTRETTLKADYNPITGEGLGVLLSEERALLEIKDFAIKRQWVPTAMMNNPMIREIIECGSIKEFIKSKQWQSGTPTKLDIERQIRRIRHRHDFCFWAFFCIRIKAKSGGRIRFKLNRPQLLLLSLCEKLRRDAVPIDVIILKARQWGGSTFSIFYQAWIAFKWDEYHNFTIAAQVGGTAETILSMLKDAVRDYPAWDLGLDPDTRLELSRRGVTANAYVLKDSTHNQVFPTVIYIGSAERPETLRGSDVHGAHYSEVGIWADTPERRPEALIADISGGMTKKALDMQVMESTAKSSDDFFHEVWVSSLKGESSYHPIFIPWFYIPHDTIPVKDKREFVDWLWSHREDETPNGKWKDSGKHYWWLWTLGATLEGINWYRYKRLDFTTYSQMANEAPSIWQEAFQSAGLKVFDFYEVEQMRSACRPAVSEGDLISDGSEGIDVLKNIQYLQKRGGQLKIWEMPDLAPIRDRYIVVVDIGGPRPTSDWSSVRVIDRLMMMPEFGGLEGKPSIVAEMHYHTTHELLAYDALRLAAWYNNALLVIESNTVEMENKEREVGGGGAEYILDLVSDIYPNQYVRKGSEENIGEKPLRKWGFRTDGVTKPKIIHHLQSCVHNRTWIEPSEICLEELSQYIQHDGNKFDAPPKKHDDVLMATAIGLWVCFKEMPLPTWKRATHIQKARLRGENNVSSL